MKHHPIGYTWLEVLVASTIVLVVVFLLAASVNPVRTYLAERDNQRIEKMDDIMQALLEWRYTDGASFEEMVDVAKEGRVMIGSGALCLGDYGSQCLNEDVQDGCLDLYQAGLQEVIDVVPVDTFGAVFSQEKTGFYLEATDATLTVGACAPEAATVLEMKADL